MIRRDELAGYHRTISDQLNARLTESPQFFWALVIVSVGYGYVITNRDLASNEIAFNLAFFLSYISVLWASWYLAALGYAFRFLQNCQHCVERALEWHHYAPEPGEPPDGGSLRNAFWLLPGIYHAHVAGLIAFLAIVVKAFCWHHWHHWPNGCVILLGIALLVVGIAFIFGINRHYLCKFIRRQVKPTSIQPLPSV